MSRRGMSPRRRQSILAACAVGAAFYRLPAPASAIVIRDDVSDSNYISLGNQSIYAPVGVVSESTGFGGGILISPKWVLTAAHIVAATPSSFFYGGVSLGDPNGHTVGVNQFIINPAFPNTGNSNTDLPPGQDIGVIQLSSIPAGITPSTRLFAPNNFVTTEQGKVATYIGYGETGNGLTGRVPNSQGVKRGMTNTLDINGGSFTGYSTNSAFSDFDDPNNADGFNMPNGSVVATSTEGTTSYFDSGGGVYLDTTVNGVTRTYLDGVNSAFGSLGGSFGNGHNPADATYSAINQSIRLNGMQSATLSLNEWIDNTIDNNWTNASGGAFGTASNWSVGTFTSGTPGVGDIAGFNGGTTIAVTFGGTVSNHQILVRSGDVTLNLNGFTYNLTSTMNEGGVVVGRYGTNVASLTFTGGTVNSNDAIIGHLTGSTGQISLGASAIWNLTGDMYVGGSFDGAGGTGTLNLLNSTSSLSVSGTVRVYGGGVVNYNAGSLSIGTLDVTSSGRVNVSAGANKLLRVKAVGVSVASGAKIDLTDNDMVIDYSSGSPLSTIQGYITSGFNNGAWTGSGIYSSKAASSPSGGEGGKTALGYGEANTLGITTFDGVAVDSTAILVKYTYRGDANLDGKVDMSDIYLLSQHWLSTGQTWANGDFNYDGTVNAKDLGLLALNWQVGENSGALGMPLDLAAFGLTPADLSAVPEPTGLAIISGVLFMQLSRRRRKNSL